MNKKLIRNLSKEEGITKITKNMNKSFYAADIFVCLSNMNLRNKLECLYLTVI
jgi:hypothetical protein